MKNTRWLRMLKLAPFALLFVALFGWVVMALWNWLMPALFGLKLLGYWQALGLVVLCRILFGGRGSMLANGMMHRRSMAHWERMTPEERERFRQGFMGRMHTEAPAGGTPSE